MLTITIADVQTRALLQQARAHCDNLGPLLAAVGEAMHARVDARFADQAGPDGRHWAPNAPSTLRRKRGRGQILVDRGRLRQQIVWRVSGNTLTLAATMQYAAIQQFGGRIERQAYQRIIRHRTNRKGDLLRSAIMGGRGLIFAKRSHKLALARTVDVGAHAVTIPARPFMPLTAAGALYPDERAAIARQCEQQVATWLAQNGPQNGPA